MPAYLLREGEGKAIAIYSRCEDELLFRAELLVMLKTADKKVPTTLEGAPVHGYYDVDPTYTRSEFLESYKKDPKKFKKLKQAKRTVRETGWNFPFVA